MLSKPRNRKTAAILALVSAIPLPLLGISLHLAGLHKFYLGQKWWGVLYVLLAFTPIPAVAGVIEGIWYLIQDPDEFDQNFNEGMLLEEADRSLQMTRKGSLRVTRKESPTPSEKTGKVSTIAQDLRELDQLRQDGLISEYEFEQKRRKLLDRIH
ncbi:SHOCT domain-containing protein [Phormidesmis sp. 146-33]